MCYDQQKGSEDVALLVSTVLVSDCYVYHQEYCDLRCLLQYIKMCACYVAVSLGLNMFGV